MTHVVTPIAQVERAVRIREVCNKTGLSRTHLYRLIARRKFPAPIQISERVSVWREADIDEWLREKFYGSPSKSVELNTVSTICASV